ncbi:MAG: Type 1 glutamine amidotransferase-like domain-containing protein [Clostridia bacterium]|nr:Type 1 glutamine amidotransferase-like domain-containing protein [Clostridia bacterium]
MINILANIYDIDEDWCLNTFRQYIKSDSKVAIIPFSFRDAQIDSKEKWHEVYNPKNGLYYHGIIDPFESYGINEKQIKWINYFETSKEEAKKIILDSDVLYFTGGLPDRMMERLIEFELVPFIEKHTGVLIGFSAGAVIQKKQYHLTPDKDYATFKYYKGMDMLEGFNVEIHFTHSELQMESIHKVLEETQLPVYAIEDEGALIIENNVITPVGKVHFFDRI